MGKSHYSDTYSYRLTCSSKTAHPGLQPSERGSQAMTTDACTVSPQLERKRQQEARSWAGDENWVCSTMASLDLECDEKPNERLSRLRFSFFASASLRMVSLIWNDKTYDTNIAGYYEKTARLSICLQGFLMCRTLSTERLRLPHQVRHLASFHIPSSFPLCLELLLNAADYST